MSDMTTRVLITGAGSGSGRAAARVVALATGPKPTFAPDESLAWRSLSKQKEVVR